MSTVISPLSATHSPARCQEYRAKNDALTSAVVRNSRAHVPTIHPTAFIHPRAVVVGDVTLGARVSIWPTAVLRGDSDSITIGDDSNVQDGTIVHADDGIPTTIGKRVGIGHRAIVHGTTIEDDCLIAMGAILLNGVHVGSGSIIGAGAVCREGMKIPPNSLVLGVPGRVTRETTPEDRDRIRRTVESYLDLQERHKRGEYATAIAPTASG
jgi:carbonic anhydrase/acetyltransferase-like protein (isoleucine patch superfamily)